MHGVSRKEGGCAAERVYRAVDDPQTVCVVMTLPSRPQIDAYLADPSLAEAMSRAGVTAAPAVNIAVTEQPTPR